MNSPLAARRHGPNLLGDHREDIREIAFPEIEPIGQCGRLSRSSSGPPTTRNSCARTPGKLPFDQIPLPASGLRLDLPPSAGNHRRVECRQKRLGHQLCREAPAPTSRPAESPASRLTLANANRLLRQMHRPADRCRPAPLRWLPGLARRHRLGSILRRGGCDECRIASFQLRRHGRRRRQTGRLPTADLIAQPANHRRAQFDRQIVWLGRARRSCR